MNISENSVTKMSLVILEQVQVEQLFKASLKFCRNLVEVRKLQISTIVSQNRSLVKNLAARVCSRLFAHRGPSLLVPKTGMKSFNFMEMYRCPG